MNRAMLHARLANPYAILCFFSFFFPFGLSFFSPPFGLHFSCLFFPSGPLPESSAFLAPVTVHADFKATAALHHLAYAKLLRLTNEIADNRANQDNPQGWELASNQHLYTHCKHSNYSFCSCD